MAYSVAEQVKSFKFITDLCNLDKDSRDVLYNFYFKYAEDPVTLELFDTVQKLLPEMKEFEDCLKGSDKNAYNLYVAQTRPLIVSPKGVNTALRVYPNIVLNPGTIHSSLNTLTITDILNSFSEFFKVYEKDKADLHFEQKWGCDKIEKRLNTYLDMDTARALSRHLKLDYKDNQIRDLAIRLDIARKPLELIYCEKPEDYTTMYGSGPSSCMAVNGSGHQAWEFLTRIGLCPASFYHYFKYTKGVYIQQRGTVAARSILYKTSGDAAKEVWQYGRVYSSNAEMNGKFIKALHDAGYSSMGGAKYAPPSKYVMVLPGYDMSMSGINDYGAPFPYFDNMDYYGKGFAAVFNRETKEFTLTYNVNVDERSVVPISGRGGHIRGNDYIKRQCEHCKRNSFVLDYGQWLSTNDGHLYCGPSCAHKMQYIEVVQGNGNIAWQQDDKALIKVEYLRFTTLQAAYQCGYFPKLADLGIIPEEHGTQLSNRGHRLQDHVTGEYYTTHTKIFPNYKFEGINEVPCFQIEPQTSRMVFDPTASLVEEKVAA